MANKRFYWLKLQKDFFKSKEMKKLRRLAGGDTYTIIYLKLQLLSLENNGFLYFDNIEDSFIEELALEIDEDSDNVKFTVLFLTKVGLIEEVEQDIIKLPEVVKNTGSETQSTIRARRSRLKTLQCNTDATQIQRVCNKNATPEKELEKELEIREKIKEKPKGFQRYPFIESFFIDKFKEYPENVEKAIREHMELRDKQKCSKTERAIKSYLENLKKLSGGQFLQMVEILHQSSDNGWKGLFKLKEENKKKINESSYNTKEEKGW